MSGKSLTLLVACWILLGSSAARADEPNLADLGLGGLEVVAEQEAKTIRGRSASAGYSGQSLVAAYLVSPKSGSSVNITAINSVGSIDQSFAYKIAASGMTSSAMAFQWDVDNSLTRVQGIAAGQGTAGTR